MQDHHWRDQWRIRICSEEFRRCRQNTSSHARFSHSCRVAHVWAHSTFTHTTRLKARCSQESGGSSCALKKKIISSHSMFRMTLFPHRHRRQPLATCLEGTQSGYWLTHFSTQVMSPSPGSTSAVSTRRSITPGRETVSTSRMSSPPQSQLPKTSRVFFSNRQPAVAGSLYQQMR